MTTALRVIRALNQRFNDQMAWRKWVDGDVFFEWADAADGDEFTTDVHIKTRIAWERHQYDWRGIYGTPGR